MWWPGISLTWVQVKTRGGGSTYLTSFEGLIPLRRGWSAADGKFSLEVFTATKLIILLMKMRLRNLCCCWRLYIPKYFQNCLFLLNFPVYYRGESYGFGWWTRPNGVFHEKLNYSIQYLPLALSKSAKIWKFKSEQWEHKCLTIPECYCTVLYNLI